MTEWPSPSTVGITTGLSPLCGFPLFLLRTLVSSLSHTCNVKLKEEESIAGVGKVKWHHDLVFKMVARLICDQTICLDVVVHT